MGTLGCIDLIYGENFNSENSIRLQKNALTQW